jgi:serine-type D-Ala-D-Ala carboxypeptidase (penicillin-binding protein 5/6)
MIAAHRTFFIFISFTAALFALAFALWLVSRPAPEQGAAVATEPFPPSLALNPDALTARAAALYDPATGRMLFAKNISEPLPLASLTKVMAAETVLAHVPPDLSVIITAEALAPEGDSGLQLGESWQLKDLLLYGLVASSNDAMAAAVGALGQGAIDTMNREAGRLGLTDTYFLNPTGLDHNTEISGAYGSARDVAVLAATFMRQHPDYFAATSQTGVSFDRGDRMVAAAATALPLLSTPGFIGAKTGYTDLAGGNLVAAFDIEVGRPLIGVVLGSTREGRFADMQTLITAARAAAKDI